MFVRLFMVLTIGENMRNVPKLSNKDDVIKVFFVRHGETDYNIKNLRQGQLDIPLNKNGEKQAKDVAKILCQKIEKIERNKVCLVCSDLQRAKDTAKMIQKELKLPQVIEERDIRETNYGNAEGKSREVLLDYINYEAYNNFDHPEYWSFKYRGETAETREIVANRFYRGVQKYIANYPDKKILIFVSHSNCIKLFLEKYIFGKKIPKLGNGQFEYLELRNFAKLASNYY
jgi:uncharacterized phosphatase